MTTIIGVRRTNNTFLFADGRIVDDNFNIITDNETKVFDFGGIAVAYAGPTLIKSVLTDWLSDDINNHMTDVQYWCKRFRERAMDYNLFYRDEGENGPPTMEGGLILATPTELYHVSGEGTPTRVSRNFVCDGSGEQYATGMYEFGHAITNVTEASFARNVMDKVSTLNPSTGGKYHDLYWCVHDERFKEIGI